MNATYNHSAPGKMPGQSGPKSRDGADDNLSMPLWVQLLWTIVFTVMVAVAVGGNCIVIWIVTGKIYCELHYSMYTFLANKLCYFLLSVNGRAVIDL